MLTSPFSPPRITPPAEHPRVMLRRRDFDRIRRNLTLPECAREAALWEKLCGMDFADFDDIIENGVYHSLVCLILEAKALKALLNDDRTLSRDMIAMALRLSGRYNPESDWLMKARFGGHIVYVCAVCYDWLYPYFTEEEKNKLIENCESILYATLETGYPPLKQSPISSHGTEAQLLRDCMSFAIAVYDQRPDIYNCCAGRVFDEYVPTYKMFYSGRFQLQGPAYGGYRYCFSAWCQLLFEAMSGEKIFDSNMENMCESLLYLLRPDGEYMRLGNDFNESKGKNSYTNRAPATVPMFYAGAMTGKSCYRDYYFQNYHEKFLLPDKYGRDYYSDGSFSESMLSPTAFLVFNRFTEPVETPPLPAAQYFGSPAGVTLYKKDADENRGSLHHRP